jgi:hypothetical protein
MSSKGIDCTKLPANASRTMRRMKIFIFNTSHQLHSLN